MRKLTSRTAMPWLVLGLLLLATAFAAEVRAQAPVVDPAATQILQRMTAYISSLQKFSVHTQNNLEDERKGDQVDQIFYYDGKKLTLYNPSEKVYATEPAPGTIEEMLDYTRETLGLMVPVADLVYRNSFELLMEDVTLAIVVGKSVIGGVSCDHLLFSRPGVGFQVWVAERGQPLPYKYVVTDTGIPSRLSISTVMSDWNVSPSEDDSKFTFVPPKDAQRINFMPL